MQGRVSRIGLVAYLGVAALLGLGLVAGCPPMMPGEPNDANEPNDMNMPGEPNEPNTPTMGDSGVTGKFIGSAVCAQCHTNVHSDWEKTLHSRALATLEAIGQGSNAACLPCHTIGFGQEGGFVDRATTNSLANVGCENCHGPSRDHVMNVTDATLRPPVNIASSVCGECHTGEHHPTYEEWQESRHAMFGDHPADSFVAGSSLNSCGKCHSGEMFYWSIIQQQTVADDALEGTPLEDLVGVSCAICHDPHAQTGNAPTPEDGRDFQLRYKEVATPTPTNTVQAATDPTRFNLCGQCHHSRGREWTSTSRGPHHSVQMNVYVGEMPLPEGDDEEPTPLVLSRVSVHSFAVEQCATCHLYRQDFMDENAPAIAGHTFEVNNKSCATAGCHPSEAQALAVKETLQMEIEQRIANVKALLGDPATWQYSSEGGPADQSGISDAVKQARFLISYAENDGSLGIHNPAYVRDMLIKAEELATP